MGVRDFAQTGLRKSILKNLGAGAESTEVRGQKGPQSGAKVISVTGTWNLNCQAHCTEEEQAED